MQLCFSSSSISWQPVRSADAARRQRRTADSLRSTLAPGGAGLAEQSRLLAHSVAPSNTSREAGSTGRFTGHYSREQHTKYKKPVVKQEHYDVPVVREGGGSTATFFSTDTFAAVGADQEIVDALATIGIQRPSYVQAAGFKTISDPRARHVVLADHAGSGKTLGYLLPIIQALRHAEKAAEQDVSRVSRQPRALVLAPTSELVQQVTRVARALAQSGAPFRSIPLTGGHRWRTQKDALAGGVDLVVATPGRLLEHLKAGNLLLDNCQTIVLDEVDVLLGNSAAFDEQIKPLRAAAPSSTRFVLVTATLPEHIYLTLQQDFPGIVAALGPGLHKSAPGTVEQLIDCSGGEVINEDTGFERKATALLRLLHETKVARTIVFCNKIETCRKVENLLLRKDKNADQLVVLPYHAAIADGIRSNNLQAFLERPDGTRMVLVCTDRASRGVDSAYVEHVVLFDFPRDPSEYVRRVGRTARGAGGQGVVSILVMGRQVKLAKSIMERTQKGLPIHSVPIADAEGKPFRPRRF